ncbi:hypothetical protein HY448_02545 [Candidatus Pacearchaeota archaeon]|nr:hypothetical protein [Candidatus Pacearchaeota archaeon]
MMKEFHKFSKKSLVFLIIVFITSVGLFGFANADIISVNSGGNTELVISNDNYTGGFFIKPPLCGDTFLDLGEECEDGNPYSGDGCSNVCAVEPPAVTGDTGSGGGGGAGGGGGLGGESPLGVISSDLIANPSELSVSVNNGVGETREITFTNVGVYNLIVNLKILGDEIVGILTTEENIFSLNPGQQRTIVFNIRTESGGLFTGRLLADYSIYTLEIPVVIGSSSENFLFDISVYLGSAFKKIVVGNKITAQFNLIEVNVKEKVDVTAVYIIKDFLGNKHYEGSETYYVLGEKNYFMEFPTEDLKPGKYVLGFEVTYPGAFAVSSDTFEVVDNKIRFDFRTILVIAAILGVIFIIWLVRLILVNRTQIPSNNNI